MKGLKDKVVVVTGGAKGIGEACVKKFAEEESKVAIFDVDIDAASKLADELEQKGYNAIAVKCNVADQAEVKKAFSIVFDTFETVDFLVNNAGIARDAIFHKMTEEQWDTVMGVNARGLFNCTQEAYRVMKEKKYGKIVNISSANSSGEAGQANYAFTKAGIIAFTKSLAREGGRYNINVNSVRPAVIETEIWKTVPQELIDKQINATAFKRMGQSSEVADVVAFLCSDEATWVTGEEILVAGGYIYR